MKNSHKICLFLMLLARLLFPGNGYSQLEIIRTMSAFDAYYLLDSLEVSHLELNFSGPIARSDIKDWNRGPISWGAPPRIAQFEASSPDSPDGGLNVTWMDQIHPVRSGETHHFGLETEKNGAFDSVDVRAYWTRIRRIQPIPMPWQIWWVDRQDSLQVVSYISLSYLYDQPVVISREFALLAEPVLLERLNWEAFPSIEWLPVEAPDSSSILQPGDAGLMLEIEISPAVGAVLVRYTVANVDSPEQIITRFANEAILEYKSENDSIYAQIVGSLCNFDLLNSYDRSFDKLELNVFGLSPADILDTYQGTHRWGNPPRIHAFPGGFFTNPYDGYALPCGVQVSWFDLVEPFQADEIRHFGLAINPYLNENLFFFGVLGYWSQAEKVTQIPAPWQRWEVDARIVRNRIHLSDNFPEPVLVNREYTQSQAFVQLDSLNWDIPDLDWEPVPEDDSLGTTLNPGEELMLEIPIEDTEFKYGCVFVRYTVAPASNPKRVITRFIHEAEIFDPPASRVPIMSSELPQYWLGQNYPNPFNAETEITFGIPKTEHIALTIHNALGQYICTLFDGYKKAGYYSLSWDGKDDSGSAVASGLYFYNIRTKDFVQTKKLLLMR